MFFSFLIDEDARLKFPRNAKSKSRSSERETEDQVEELKPAKKRGVEEVKSAQKARRVKAVWAARTYESSGRYGDFPGILLLGSTLGSTNTKSGL